MNITVNSNCSNTESNYQLPTISNDLLFVRQWVQPMQNKNINFDFVEPFGIISVFIFFFFIISCLYCDAV